jgi:hypothetical protein
VVTVTIVVEIAVEIAAGIGAVAGCENVGMVGRAVAVAVVGAIGSTGRNAVMVARGSA